MIWEELDKNLIFMNLDAITSDDVMEKVGGQFVKYGYCKDSFVEALKAREREFPTGLDINGVGVAIPHTDVAHVNSAGIAIAKLADGVEFIQMGTDDYTVSARLIFMLTVDNPKEQLTTLQNILHIIQDNNTLNKLLEADSVEQVIEIIKEKETVEQ